MQISSGFAKARFFFLQLISSIKYASQRRRGCLEKKEPKSDEGSRSPQQSNFTLGNLAALLLGESQSASINAGREDERWSRSQQMPGWVAETDGPRQTLADEEGN